MNLDDIRKDIDNIDGEIRTLIMKRLDCSRRVVASKIESQNFNIYRADREQAMLEKLGDGIEADRLAGYLSVVRKITETSRMYQYGILYDWNEDLFAPLIAGIDIPAICQSVSVLLTRPNTPGSMAAVLSMIGDYGYNVAEMVQIDDANGDPGITSDSHLAPGSDSQVTFKLRILGDLNEKHMKKLMFQLSKECIDFKILNV